MAELRDDQRGRLADAIEFAEDWLDVWLDGLDVWLDLLTWPQRRLTVALLHAWAARRDR
jgi:hypothetical protein